MTIFARFTSSTSRRGQLAACVVAVGIVRLDKAQAVFDGETRRDDEKPSRKVFAAGAAYGVDRLPRDQHCHDGGLAGTGGQFQGETQKLGIGVFVGGGQEIKDSLAALRLGSDLGQPDGRFYGFHLAEERADAGEFVIAPVLKQPCRLGSYLPLAGLGPGPPQIYMAAHFVDDRCGIVLLLLGR